MQKVSVLICTRNRSDLLKLCLTSLENQTTSPYEIVIIDNDSRDDTKATCKAFTRLPIVYKEENKIGLPFARNASIRLAKGQILAFIDDDCEADKHWIESIYNHFSKYPKSVGLIGKTLNENPYNIYSAVEYEYYLRWISENVNNPKRVERLSSGVCIDFKNAGFLGSFVKNFRFSSLAPYGDVGDEDIELGHRMYEVNKNIYFDPSIVISHKYSLTFKRMITRNFWNGYANQMLYQMQGINPATKNNLEKKNEPTQMDNLFLQAFYIGIKNIYPLFSRLGRLYALTTKSKIIPPR